MKRTNERKHRASVLLAFVVLAALLAALIPQATTAQAGNIIHVNINAATGGDGASWGTAYKYLQDALAAAADGDEIWVAKGTYYPDLDEGGNVTDNDRAASFALKAGVSIYGGFAVGDTSRNQRDWDINLTVLSGAIGGSGSSFHVVTANAISGTVTLDGFTITAGNANGPTTGGGGMRSSGTSNVELANIVFSGNQAAGTGGGLDLRSGNAVMNRVTFENNISVNSGGGMFLGSSTGSVLTDVAFIGNKTVSYTHLRAHETI